MIISTTPTKTLLQANIKIGSTIIEQCGHNYKNTSIKFLGIMIDDRLSWTDHITYVKSKLIKIIALISQIKKHFPSHLKIMVFKSLFMPHLLYGIATYGHSNETKVLFKYQKWGIRSATNSHIKCHTNSIFAKNNILKFRELYEHTILLYLKKTFENIGPAVMNEIFPHKITRTHIYFTQQMPTNKKLDKFPNLTFPILWNSNKFRPIPVLSVTSFGKHVKKIMMERYNYICKIKQCFNCQFLNKNYYH